MKATSKRAQNTKKKTGTAPLAYDGARGRTGQRRARRALSGRAHRVDGAAVVALTLAARPVPPGRQVVPAPFEGDVKALQLIINVDKEAKNPDSEDGLRAIESIAKNFILHARISSLFLSQINDRNYVEF